MCMVDGASNCMFIESEIIDEGKLEAGFSSKVFANKGIKSFSF